MLESPRALRPSHLDYATGIGKDVAYRILKAVRSEDPITTIHLLPGPAPLRRLLKAAAGHAANSPAIARAHEAVDAFERFVRTEAGDRGTLDLIISGWLPEARQKGELLAKQAVFRGISHIRGLSADVLFDASLLQPSDDGQHLDNAWVRGLGRFRRWRRGIELQFASRRIHPPPGASTSLSLDGRPIAKADDWVIGEFSSVEPARLEVLRTAGAEFYTLHSDALGMRSAADVAFAELLQRCLTRYRVPGVARRSASTVEISVPTRLLISDVLLHADAYPGSQPQLYIYDTCLSGVADVNDPRRDRDRLPMNETIDFLGKGVDGLHLKEVPRYVELLRHVLQRLGWDASAFRAYRCRIEYPLYASQVSMVFERATQP